MKRFKKFGKRFLAIALIAMSVFAVALPAAIAATYSIKTTVNLKTTEWANLRKTADPNGTVLAKPYGGQTIWIESYTGTGNNNEWIHTYYNGTEGYLRYDLVVGGKKGTGGSDPGSGTVTPPSGTPIDGYCNASNVIIRTSPHSAPNDNQSGTMLSLNQSVKFVDTKMNSNGTDGLTWFYITSPRTGYVYTQYITKVSTPAPTTPPVSNELKNGYIVGNSTTVTVYSEAKTSSSARGTITLNSALKFRDASGGWAYVEYGNLKGYVILSYIKEGTPPVAPSGYSTLNNGQVFSETRYPRASEVFYDYTIISNNQGGSFYVKIIAQMTDYSGKTWKRQVEQAEWVTVPAGGSISGSIYKSIRGMYNDDIITEVRLEVWNFSNIQGCSVKIPTPTFK